VSHGFISPWPTVASGVFDKAASRTARPGLSPASHARDVGVGTRNAPLSFLATIFRCYSLEVSDGMPRVRARMTAFRSVLQPA
jgi:hypothetical protein